MYPENHEGTQVIVGSINMGYISVTLPRIELTTCSVPSGSRSHRPQLFDVYIWFFKILENLDSNEHFDSIKKIICFLTDENFAISNSRRGIVGMANQGPHSNGSQFYILLAPAKWMDTKYVAFGLVGSSAIVTILFILYISYTVFEQRVEVLRNDGCWRPPRVTA